MTPFTEHYRTLERIARQLEDGDADLDAVLPLIEEATAAYQACKTRLEAVRAALSAAPEALEDTEDEASDEDFDNQDLEPEDLDPTSALEDEG